MWNTSLMRNRASSTGAGWVGIGSPFVVGAAGKHRLDFEARPRELGYGAIDFAALLFEPHGAVLEFWGGDLQLGASSVAEIIKVEHFAHLLQRKADPFPHQDVAQPGAVAPAVKPFLAVAARREQSLLFVEAQRARAHLELSGEVADGENLAAGGAAIETGHEPLSLG